MEVATLDMEVAEETEHVAGVSNTVVTYINSETGEEVFPDMDQFVEEAEGQETIGVYHQETEEVHEGYQEVAEGEYQEVEAETAPGQDLVSLAMETSKVISDSNEIPEATEVIREAEVIDEDYPDEIECQLVQKSVFIGGQVQTIDFIMCNQCPRLFRTENLLWNHIKAKHKRRTYRRMPLQSSMMDQYRRHSALIRNIQEGELEPGEIDKPLTSPNKDLIKTETPSKEHALFVVGLDKRFEGATPDEKFQRQKARKRIYVDSNHGPFKCPGCDNVTFTNRRSLDMHMKRLHKAGIVECDECGRKVLDLKRHKEILHKRFKIFDCPHCQDKFCTQEDLERHLAKVEKNNMVKGETKQLQPLRPKPATDENIENTELTEKNVEKGKEAEKEKGNAKTPTETADVENRENNDKNTSEVVKELEAKTFSCSECGMKTHSRMTYIQHVLNGCIMDMVLGEGGESTPIGFDGEPIKRSKRGRPKGSTNKNKRAKVEI